MLLQVAFSYGFGSVHWGYDDYNAIYVPDALYSLQDDESQYVDLHVICFEGGGNFHPKQQEPPKTNDDIIISPLSSPLLSPFSNSFSPSSNPPSLPLPNPSFLPSLFQKPLSHSLSSKFSSLPLPTPSPPRFKSLHCHLYPSEPHCKHRAEEQLDFLRRDNFLGV